jgi:hypothetical protein
MSVTTKNKTIGMATVRYRASTGKLEALAAFPGVIYPLLKIVLELDSFHKESLKQRFAVPSWSINGIVSNTGLTS